jgi:adenosylcobinamide-GDP ribazoletransferase
MRLIGAAIAFLTRVPINPTVPFDAADVGRSTRWYPLIGALIGGLYFAVLRAGLYRFSPAVVAALIVLTEALVTGALHMDALADAADGLGGGKGRADMIRIMRDHAIGSYGGTALAILVALKVTAIAQLATSRHVLSYLVLAPTLGRWSIIPLCRFLPYADENKGGPRETVGKTEMVWATVLGIIITAGFAGWRGFVCWLVGLLATLLFGRFCYRKIGGVTGDTLGTNVEICECAVLLTGLILR